MIPTPKHHALFVPLALLTASAPALAQDLLYGVDGGAAGEGFGAAVAAVGDVDSDGRSDFVAGAPGASSDQVRLFSGADGTLLMSWSGLASGDGFGSSVAGVGDVDGDTIPDIAATAPTGGYTRILSGADGSLIDHLSVPSEVVVGGGDLNADGSADYAISGIGEVRAFSGATGALLFHVTGHATFGSAMDAAGDVDQDGHDDLVVGAWAEQTAGPESGAVYVLSGDDGTAIWTVFGGSFHWFGIDVAAVGDVDGDGWEDFAGQSRVEHFFTLDRPFARVYSGADGTLIHEIEITTDVEMPEGTLSRAGDVDGDGRADFFAGGRRWSGGFDLGLYSGRDARRLWDLVIPHSEQAIDLLGDLDGDGRVEFLLGDEELAANTGRVELRSVHCVSPVETYCPIVPNSAGLGALLAFHGELSISSNDFHLESTGGIPNAFGVIFYGPTQIQTPFGDGFRCVGGGGVGVFRLNPPQAIDPSGNYSRQVDFSTTPAGAGPGAITPGSTWNFQHWFRDAPAGLSGFNLSDGLSASFCP